MTDNQWYPFYVGDYGRKTAHLSMLEHGAYRLLLDHYYATRHPLPADPKILYRICRAFTPGERKSVHKILQEFFTNHDAQYVNKRCSSVIDKQLKYSESQSAKAKLRYCPGLATAQPTKTKSIVKANALTYTDAFEQFWFLFPKQRRGNKEKGHAAWVRATTRTTEETIYAGLQAYAISDEVKRGFAKGAEGWLNDDRWKCDYSIKPEPKPAAPIQPTKREQAKAAILRAAIAGGYVPSPE